MTNKESFISLTPNAAADKTPITIFHGSPNVLKKPTYGAGRPNNDYGVGFYTTMNKELAGEWAVFWTEKDGRINEYNLDRSNLETLKLDALDIKHWIAILMTYRKGIYKEELTHTRIQKFTSMFGIDLSPYDLITGWRADDAFFAFVEDFTLGLLSIENLQRAMQFGDMGVQTCLKSERAFENLEFVASYPAPASQFLSPSKERDNKARSDYRSMIRSGGASSGLLITDIVGRD